MAKDPSRTQLTANLVNRALGLNPSPAAPNSDGGGIGDDGDSLGLTFEEAEDLYFAAETPEERDAAFAFLAGKQEPEAQAFLAAMMAHDEDPFLRLAAAHHLAQRGIVEAQVYVVQTLLHASDDLLFEQALEAVISSRDPGLLEPLATIWRDEGREPGERRLAMLAMERVDKQGALKLWREELGRIPNAHALSLDRLSIAMAALAQDAGDGFLAVATHLRQKIAKTEFADEMDRDAFVCVLDDAQAMRDSEPEG